MDRLHEIPCPLSGFHHQFLETRVSLPTRAVIGWSDSIGQPGSAALATNLKIVRANALPALPLGGVDDLQGRQKRHGSGKRLRADLSFSGLSSRSDLEKGIHLLL